jgi:hypothetical protein
MKHYLLCLGLLATAPSALAAVNLVDKDDWKVDMSGFLETDMINDDTQTNFNETTGNTPAMKPNGTHGRTIMSIRNSRLAFNVQAPKFDDWKTRGYLEMDFLGFDPKPGSDALNSEAGLYNNPTLRVRHAYMQGENNGWSILTGQTWAMFGWQPYYFIPTTQVSPLTGMLYSRAVQVRGMKTIDLSDTSTLQVAVGIMRPPQRDSSTPSLEAGARWAMNSLSGAFTGGATGNHKPQPLSVGLSGTVRQFELANDPANPGNGTSTKMGQAIAIDTLIPIIPSSDGKSASNNLVLGGEFTMGEGDGDQFVQWTGGQANQGPAGKMNLDPGIGGYDSANNMTLIKVQTWNVYLQYHLPENLRTWVSAGYSQIFSANIGNIATSVAANNLATAAYFQNEEYFANVSHDFTDHVRAGLEYEHINSNWVDGTTSSDNRVQLSTWFIF